MGGKLLIVFAMVLLGVGLFVWSRRRRPGMSLEAARAGYEAVRAGAPLTDELISAVAVYTAHNAYHTEGIVDSVLSPDHYGLRLVDGSAVRGTRSKALWRRGVILTPGVRVALLAVRGGDHATILRQL